MLIFGNPAIPVGSQSGIVTLCWLSVCIADVHFLVSPPDARCQREIFSTE